MEKRRKIYRMIDSGRVSELSEEEKEWAIKSLRHHIVNNYHSGDCIVKYNRRVWVLHRRLALVEGTTIDVGINVKLICGIGGWRAIPAGESKTLKHWSLELYRYYNFWRLAWIDEDGVEIIIWDFDLYEDAVEWLRGHVHILEVDEYDGDVFELLLQAIQ